MHLVVEDCISVISKIPTSKAPEEVCPSLTSVLVMVVCVWAGRGFKHYTAFGK